MNDYVEKYLAMIMAANNDDEKLREIINKIYQDGFEDGANSQEKNGE